MRIKEFNNQIKDFILTNYFSKKVKFIYKNFCQNILGKILFIIFVFSLILLVIINIFKPKIIDELKHVFYSKFINNLQLNNFNFSVVNINGINRVKKQEIIDIIKNFDDGKSFVINKNLSDSQAIPLAQNLIDEIKSKILWIDKITIKRIMPDIINIEVIEYKPFAIWLDNDKKFIIDKDGNPVPFLEEYESNEEFKNMIILSGKNANKNVKSLFNILSIDAELSKEIYSANWVGNRRWDVRFFDGLLVKLPEDNIAEAWENLLKLYELSSIDKSIKSIDLRVFGKIYIQYLNKKPNEIETIKS
ncbi:MAG: cell division protein FtsQ/DivIB [Alphaproteobacteria bacterium]